MSKAQSSSQLMSQTSRRRFLCTAGATSACIAGAPSILTASRTNNEIVVGTAPYTFRVVHNCVELPSQYTWQTTHNVAVDSDNNLYVIHEGLRDKKDHPSIFVFDEKGSLYELSVSSFREEGTASRFGKKEANSSCMWLGISK
jgi:hypothetical protein